VNGTGAAGQRPGDSQLLGTPEEPLVAASWDAGDLGCGELVVELHRRVLAVAPGELFVLTARDPGVPEDLPAWCRLTGHALVRARHPEYWIQRKEM
jgi:tRNA 2-thiouridine synthesizing protein A